MKSNDQLRAELPKRFERFYLAAKYVIEAVESPLDGVGERQLHALLCLKKELASAEQFLSAADQAQAAEDQERAAMLSRHENQL